MSKKIFFLLSLICAGAQGAIVKQVPSIGVPDDIVINWTGTSTYDAWGVVSAWSGRPDVVTVTKGSNSIIITPLKP